MIYKIEYTLTGTGTAWIEAATEKEAIKLLEQNEVDDWAEDTSKTILNVKQNREAR